MFSLLPFVAIPARGADDPAPIVARVVYASGDVQLGGDGVAVALKSNMSVREGELIRTIGNGVVYLRTEDGGFFILREDSSGLFHRYRLHPTDPKLHEFRLELVNGTGRIITGAGAKTSRDRFRFNTPVAAIGIRGTDFSVFTSTSLTRVLINSGGVALTPIGNGCQAGGLGPCTGNRTIILENSGTLAAEVNLEGSKPRPIEIDRELRNKLAPRLGEPGQSYKPGAHRGSSSTESEPSSASTTTISESKLLEASRELQNPPSPNLRWGRWQPLANLPETIEERKFISLGYQAAAFDSYNIVMRLSSTPINLPYEGQASFALRGHEGVLVNRDSGTAQVTQASDGNLLVDFGKKSFQTNLTVSGDSLAPIQIRSQGTLSSSGTFSSGVHETAVVRGALSGASNNEAAYLYRQTINPSTQLMGTTFWKR